MKVGDLVQTCYYCVDNVGTILEIKKDMVKVLWCDSPLPNWVYYTGLEVIDGRKD